MRIKRSRSRGRLTLREVSWRVRANGASVGTTGPSALRLRSRCWLLLRALFEQRWKLRQLAERSEIRVPLHVVEVVEPGDDSFLQTVEGLLALGMLP